MSPTRTRSALAGLQGAEIRPSRDVDVPLVDLLDRLLETGVAVSGDVVISVADVDLVWLGLRAALRGIDGEAAGMPLPHGRPPATAQLEAPRRGGPPSELRVQRVPARRGPRQSGERRLGIDQDDAERGLLQLVLTVVELVRELMERQALRRVETDGLSESQIERLGTALMHLDERMRELKEYFGFSDDELEPRIGTVADLG